MVSSKVILALALVCAALVPAYGLTCHQCVSTLESPNIPCLYGNSTAAACPTATTASTHCIKVVKDQDTDKEIVTKLCGIESSHSCPTGFDCFYCDADACNSSITISQSIPVIGLSVVAAYILSRFNH